uniref:Aminotransferase class I/classII domain-containing protein n=1 Tax=Romanomermis culicivorax TaxID=13658 RepID=A0A915L5S1_ROMCU
MFATRLLLQSTGTYKNERIITSKQGVSVNIKDRKEPVLNFCANNYLGLSSHPDVVESAVDALEKYGAGMSSVRFICGTQNIHKELESKIAKFHGREDAILYASCFDANAGIFEQLLGNDDAVISDKLNHASIIDGVRLCKAQKLVYNHNDMYDLEEKLLMTKAARRKMIATDGVFSMDGDVALLKEICHLAEKHKALVFIDECHATGFFGKTGRGTEEYSGVTGKVDIINSTLGKAMGGAMGGYTTASKSIIDLLRQRSRPYLFSNSLAPSIVGSAIKVYDMLMDNSSFAECLLAKVKRFRSKMTTAGFKVVGNSDHPICPVMLEDAKLASKFADKMLEHNIYVIGFSYPVVPKGQARIRVQISAAHSESDIDQCVEAFIDVGRDLNVIN